MTLISHFLNINIQIWFPDLDQKHQYSFGYLPIATTRPKEISARYEEFSS